MTDQEQIGRVQAARYEARELGYLLLVDEALNIEPLKYQAWAAPAIHGQVTMGRFLAYGESLGETAESGLATLRASLGEDEDSRRVSSTICSEIPISPGSISAATTFRGSLRPLASSELPRPRPSSVLTSAGFGQSRGCFLRATTCGVRCTDTRRGLRRTS